MVFRERETERQKDRDRARQSETEVWQAEREQGCQGRRDREGYIERENLAVTVLYVTWDKGRACDCLVCAMGSG